MQQKIQKPKRCKFFSYALFLVNILAAALVVFGIKHKEEDKLISESFSSDSDLVPVDQDVMDAQNKISSDRENKLRDLNTSPKEVRRIDTTTTTTTTTVKEEPKSSSSDSSTKSS